MAFNRERRSPLPVKTGLVAAVPAALAACYGAFVIHEFDAKRASFGSEDTLAGAMASTAQVGVGPYLIVAAGVAVVAVAWLVPLYRHSPPKIFIRHFAAASTIIGTALFVQLELGDGLLLGGALGAAIVGVAWVILAFRRVVAWRWRSRQMFGFAALLVFLLSAFLVGRLFLPSKTSVQGGNQTTAPAASDTWHDVLYQGKHADYRLVVPSYLQEAQSPLDKGADRSFVGPGGMVISVYLVADQNRFWENIKMSKRWREFKPGEATTYQSRSKGAVTSQFFEIVAEPVGDQQLTCVCVVVRADLTYALTLSVPAVWPERVRLAAAYTLGWILGESKRLEEKGDSAIAELKKPHPYSQAAIFEQLQIAGLLPGQPSTGIVQDQRPTRAQWKDKLVKNFGWFPGSLMTAEASRFQQVMGKPDDTQTLGDQTLWYYRCSDGTIQLGMNPLNLQLAGLIQANVNDY